MSLVRERTDPYSVVLALRTPPPPPLAFTYTNGIAPKMAFCNGCHTGTNPDGSYRTDSYAGLRGNGSDNVVNVIPGDETSKFVRYMAAPPGKDHKSINTIYPGFGQIVRDWVVLVNAAE